MKETYASSPVTPIVIIVIAVAAIIALIIWALMRARKKREQERLAEMARQKAAAEAARVKREREEAARARAAREARTERKGIFGFLDGFDADKEKDVPSVANRTGKPALKKDPIRRVPIKRSATTNRYTPSSSSRHRDNDPGTDSLTGSVFGGLLFNEMINDNQTHNDSPSVDTGPSHSYWGDNGSSNSTPDPSPTTSSDSGSSWSGDSGGGGSFDSGSSFSGGDSGSF